MSLRKSVRFVLLRFVWQIAASQREKTLFIFLRKDVHHSEWLVDILHITR